MASITIPVRAEAHQLDSGLVEVRITINGKHTFNVLVDPKSPAATVEEVDTPASRIHG